MVMAMSTFLLLLALFVLLHHHHPTQAILNLERSDSSTLSLFKKDLGWLDDDDDHHPCNSSGIVCENSLVIKIVLESQHLAGFLSPAIGRFTELKELSLPNNQLVDRIPSQLMYCHNLQVLNLRNNRFSGKVPPQLSSLVSLRVLDLSSNHLSGDLSFLKYFPNLENLSLAHNFFTGKLPLSLKSFSNLRFLDLSGNHALEQGSLVFKAINKVEIENLLPKRYVFAETKKKNSSSSPITQPPAPAPSSPITQPPAPAPSSQPKPHKDRKNIKGWVLGFIAGVAAGMISGFVFSVLFKVVLVCIKGRKKEPGPMIFSSLIKKAEDLAFLEKEDGTAALEVIGSGGCGEVYKAELPGSNGKMIAIKKVIQPPMDAADLNDEDTKSLSKKMRQIRSEIQTVGQIRHRNLLPLLAHVSRPDCHYLVYEYMKNGSLQDALKQGVDENGNLDWLVRHKIAIGIAEGLEYLHMHHSPRIIHRDLKPGNILLDDNLEARIADFGLAKAMPDAQTHITTSNIAGTVGFIAPEYHQTLKFTDKCDIYSFGVLLAVLVMGKLPSDEFFQHTDEMSQVKWLRNVMTSEDPKRAIDPKLIGNGYEEQMLLVLKIACFCTLDDPKQRPNSKDIRCMLTQVKH